uniref:hypothetical protein n=1 Tax=Pectobacterium polaris TaxID=2042057 RepID=UPI001C8D08FC
NSEVKRRSADGSVGLPHVRVGNCQASNKWKASVERQGLFAMGNWVDFTVCTSKPIRNNKYREINDDLIYPDP